MEEVKKISTRLFCNEIENLKRPALKIQFFSDEKKFFSTGLLKNLVFKALKKEEKLVIEAEKNIKIELDQYAEIFWDSEMDEFSLFSQDGRSRMALILTEGKE